jgi:hypothetical protein
MGFVFHYHPREILFSTKGLTWFCFPLGLFFRHVLHYGVEPILFYTMGVWVGRAHSCPFGVRHGMATLQPRKAKDGIFRAVVERYIFLSGVT